MSGKRILLVDDEQIVLDTVKMILEMEQHVVDQVTNPIEALERYQAAQYDLVLTDNRMPEMTGLELAEKIRESKPNQPIVLMTGYSTIGPTSSVDLVMRKPFSGDDLLRAVTRLTNPVEEA